MIDVLIIGAGPAGSLAALLLARAGWRVTLVEQHHFPRDKVCGECMSATGISVLNRAHVNHFPSEPVVLTRTLIHSADGSSCCVTLPAPMFGLSRNVLDHHLLNAAIAAGARVLQPARCEAFSTNVTIRNLNTNEVESLEARYVLRADGKAPSDQTTGDFGIKTHFDDVDGPRDAIELFAVEGSYGGLAPIEGGRWNAAFSVPAARLRIHRGDVDALFHEMTNENHTLQKRLRSARRTGPWLAAPLPRFAVTDDWQDNIIPIGNAAAAMEPIGGEGMGLALRSAELAATALINARKNGVALDVATLRSEYRRLWRLRSASCRAVAKGISSTRFAEFVMPAIDGCDTLAKMAMSAMGKIDADSA